MWMANLVVVLVILGCVAYQYLKGTLVKSFATVIAAICSAIVAFSYFEFLADVFISRSDDSRFLSLAPWAQSLCFVLLFVLAFAILQTIVVQLTRQPIDLGSITGRIVRTVCGIFLGLILSGILLTALAVAPLRNKYPYQRFDPKSPDAEKPNKALFNTDGFVTGLFSTVSKGSFIAIREKDKRSFAVVHPAFLDQIFLNRHNIADDISILTSSNAIEVPRKKGAWPAPEDLNAEDRNEPVRMKSGYNLTIVRVGIKKDAVKGGCRFTPSQLRLACKPRGDEHQLTGEGKNIYPIGYLKTQNLLQRKQLNDEIKINRDNFQGKVRWIDFAFYIPEDFVPVLVEFKQNSIARVPPPVTAGQAPSAIPFIQLSECARDIAELQPISSAEIYGVELATGTELLAKLSLEIKDARHWEDSETFRSIKPAQFEDDKISYARAELQKVEPTEPAKKERGRRRRSYGRRRKFVEELKGLPAMLKPLNGYKLVSLRCNNPSTGTAIKGEQLPVLVEVGGLTHHAVGVITSGEISSQTFYEVDYCSVTNENITDGLTIAEDGFVAEPFPDSVWLTEDAKNISEFYVLYLIKAKRGAIITSVQASNLQSAGFKEYEGFFIK